MASSKQREVTILVRYEFKQDAYIKELNTYVKAGSIVLLVENDKGARYHVILRSGGQHACSCSHVPSKKSPTCYHINYARKVENQRAAQLVAKRKDEQEIEAIIA